MNTYLEEKLEFYDLAFNRAKYAINF